MRIGLASDHRGFKLKNVLKDYLEKKGYLIKDYGTFSSEPCDYPDYVCFVVEALKSREIERGIIICYTGIGSCIAANRAKGIRAALVWDIKMAELARRHNNSNVLVLGAGWIKSDYAKRIVLRWLNTDFEGGRHLRRLKKIEEKIC